MLVVLSRGGISAAQNYYDALVSWGALTAIYRPACVDTDPGGSRPAVDIRDGNAGLHQMPEQSLSGNTRGAITRAPVSGGISSTLMPSVHQEMSTYTPDEIRRVLRAADKDRNGHLWYLALSGLRRAEIAGLRWSDVDLGAGTITVMRNRARRARAMWSRVTPKHCHRGARCHLTRASLAVIGPPEESRGRPINYSDAD